MNPLNRPNDSARDLPVFVDMGEKVPYMKEDQAEDADQTTETMAENKSWLDTDRDDNTGMFTEGNMNEANNVQPGGRVMNDHMESLHGDKKAVCFQNGQMNSYAMSRGKIIHSARGADNVSGIYG